MLVDLDTYCGTCMILVGETVGYSPSSVFVFCINYHVRQGGLIQIVVVYTITHRLVHSTGNQCIRQL